jgi:hypothetical protein
LDLLYNKRNKKFLSFDKDRIEKEKIIGATQQGEFITKIGGGGDTQTDRQQSDLIKGKAISVTGREGP